MNKQSHNAVEWLEVAGEALGSKWPALLALVVLILFLALCAPLAHAADDQDGGTVELVTPGAHHAVWTGCAPAEVHMHAGTVDVLVFCPTPPVWHTGTGNDAMEAEADRVQAAGFEVRAFGSHNTRVTVVLSVAPDPGQPIWWQGQTCTLADLDTNSAQDAIRAACPPLDNGQ